LPAPTPEVLARVSALSASDIEVTLGDVHVPARVIDDVVAQWGRFRADGEWTSLLAALVEWVDRCRGDIDAPIPIWDDLDDAGANGRLFYFYLFAICYADACAFLRSGGCPPEIVDSTMSVLRRHVQTHEHRRGTIGIEPGWWLLPILRGEMVQVGSLQFHRVNLGVGSLSPAPWYTREESLVLGEGFRRADPSVGIHIPEGAALAEHELDETFTRAREVLGDMWPVEARRLATCQSWLLDEQLAEFLDPESRIMRFQRRFTLLDRWYDNDAETVDFIFQRPGVPLSELPRDTSLQRGVLDLLERGGHWHAQPGWLDFDGG
jgi:hypothetical protein